MGSVCTAKKEPIQRRHTGQEIMPSMTKAWQQGAIKMNTIEDPWANKGSRPTSNGDECNPVTTV